MRERSLSRSWLSDRSVATHPPVKSPETGGRFMSRHWPYNGYVRACVEWDVTITVTSRLLRLQCAWHLDRQSLVQSETDQGESRGRHNGAEVLVLW
ncbi:hypothetical protein BaRGS_00002565 [Batillaria attramentaria]|uniref:Uncharacterized protein n=1 Tax=Batillaria attramentaria TaxID=370345 RepID=A0ABD0M433_9CAEN